MNYGPDELGWLRPDPVIEFPRRAATVRLLQKRQSRGFTAANLAAKSSGEIGALAVSIAGQGPMLLHYVLSGDIHAGQ